MIETIYSNENGESNHTNRVQATFKMPKNIRQVGKSNVSKKIYVEDYVMTFIKQMSDQDCTQSRVAVLVGQYVKIEESRNIFISGAIEVEEMKTVGDIQFTNDVWSVIYENIKKYFVDSEIVGWFIGAPSYMLEDKESILKVHVDNFAGTDKTLLLFDTLEKEEAFLFYDNGTLSKQDGYYIYYDKNEEMQTYMIDHRNIPSEEVDYEDRVSREIRTVIHNKKQDIPDDKNTPKLIYAAGTLLALIVLVVGAAMLTNYDQMKVMQDNMQYLTDRMDDLQSVFADKNEGQVVVDETTPAVIDGDSEDNLNVEVVPGEVEPVEEEDKLAQEDTPTATTEAEPEEEEEDETVPASATTSTYIVETGDTLAGISWKLYASWNYMSKIKELNNIDDEDMIYVGQKLIVP